MEIINGKRLQRRQETEILENKQRYKQKAKEARKTTYLPGRGSVGISKLNSQRFWPGFMIRL